MQILLMRQECGRCSSAVPIWSDVCQECGLVLHSRRQLRAAGVLYLVLGTVLTAPAVYGIVWAAGVMARSDDPAATTRFTGDAWDAVFVFAVFGFVLAVGVVGLAMGGWQVVHGRRNPRLVRVVMVLYVIFWMAYLGAHFLP
ncbi:MAG TPA: hypothetical protein VHG51_06870 [Longimicrobiaceae bacterium]|nr:hypothetical protein [Longimicrobiaceae bacterium]